MSEYGVASGLKPFRAPEDCIESTEVSMPVELLHPDSEEAHFQHLQITPRMPGFGAWVDDLDLSRPIEGPVAAELRRALWDYEVIFLRAQPLKPEQHIALAEVFGKLSPGSFFQRSSENPNIELILNDRAKPPRIDRWHSDLTWIEFPPLGTVLQITDVPRSGGNTAWVSTTKAFAALSPGMQAYLEGLSATHTWEASGFRDALARAGDDAVIAAFKAFKPISHPVVRVHPETGRKCLFVNRTFVKRIDGIDYRESGGILEFLFEWLQRPEFTICHQWVTNGIAIWDNRSTQHYALADYWPERRTARRVTFDDPASPMAGQNVNDLILGGRAI
jgi:taurine dioxygenase